MLLPSSGLCGTVHAGRADRLTRVSLQLFDTATREQREFVPRESGKVGMYICGLTTQGAPHIGHIRFAVAFDVLRRWLETGHDYHVTLIRNVTDIDDKVLRKAADAGEDWFALTYRNERLTTDALDALGVKPATYEPRATGHVPDMVSLMETLIEKGHAYAAPDGSGDVYFDVRSWPDYGSLSNQSLDDMVAAEDADPRGKRDPRDFALWKGRKADEPLSASWPTPFGSGRPGWHLECSAMARRWLGDEFDIHGGGIDLRFPHHENEQAQSRAAGLGFARYWLHNAWVTVKGEKMGKSLGNALEVRHLLEHTRPLVLRYYLTAAHYRSTIEYHSGSLEEAAAAVERIEGFLERVARRGEVAAPTDAAAARAVLPPEFVAAMNDDLGVSGALAAVHDTVRAGNVALEERDDDAALAAAARVVAMTEVLGVNPLAPNWATSHDATTSAVEAALDALVRARLEERQSARQERDFARADAIRDELAAVGVAITDTPAGAQWALIRTNGSGPPNGTGKEG